MTQVILDGDLAKQHIPLAKERLSAMQLLKSKFSNSVIIVEGGKILAQKLAVLNRIYIKTRRRDFVFVVRKYITNPALTVGIGILYFTTAGRRDGATVFNFLNTTTQSVAINTARAQGSSRITKSKRGVFTVSSTGEDLYLRNESNGIVGTYKRVIISLLSPDEKIVKEFFSFLCSTTDSRFYFFSGDNFFGLPVISFAPLGDLNNLVTYTAIGVNVPRGSLFAGSIYVVDDSAAINAATQIWPIAPYTNHYLRSIANAGHGYLLFLLVDSQGLHPVAVTYNMFSGLVQPLLLENIDARFNNQNLGSLYPESDTAYVGNGMSIAVIQTNSNPPTKVFRVAVATNTWTEVTGSFNAYGGPTQTYWDVPRGAHNVVSLMPGHCSFYTAGNAGLLQWVSFDSGVSWFSRVYKPAYEFDGLPDHALAPHTYVLNADGKTYRPTRFSRASTDLATTNGATSALQVNIKTYDDVLRTKLLYTVPADIDVNYQTSLGPNDIGPILTYLGDEDDRAPLLPGYKNELEIL